MKTLIFFLLLVPTFSFAKSEKLTFNNYDDIISFTKEELLTHPNDNFLIIFDIDRTLLNTQDCLPKTKKYRNGFFKFEEKVKKCNATLTSELVPGFIETLKESNIPVMAITARRDLLMKSTLEQLSTRLFSEEGKAYEIKFETSPLYSNRKKTVSFEQQGRKKTLQKKLVIKKGVGMASGANKGLALQAYLKRVLKDAETSYKRVIFIDDDNKNIKHLLKAFKESNEFLSIIHYTEFSKKK